MKGSAEPFRVYKELIGVNQCRSIPSIKKCKPVQEYPKYKLV